ncbi:hypothetical protein BASA62_004832 [Batrachochytrium salamandrivorans]|nr:hypothetical protein BASA62_004832 [Batrachochytrium salamandrivorans]
MSDLEYVQFLEFTNTHSAAMSQHLNSKLNESQLLERTSASSDLHKKFMMIWTVIVTESTSIHINKSFKNISVLGDDVADIHCRFFIWIFQWAIQSRKIDIMRLVPLLLAPEYISLVAPISDAVDGDFDKLVYAISSYESNNSWLRPSVIDCISKLVTQKGDAERICLLLQRRQSYLDAALGLALDHKLDLITHLNLIAEYPTWIKSDAKHTIPALNNIRMSLIDTMQSSETRENWAMKNSSLILRAYSSIVALWGMPLDISEIRICFSIGRKPKGSSTTQLFTSLLILLADQGFATFKDEFKEAFRDILDCKYSEFPRIIGVYFFTDQPLELKKLLEVALGMPCPIRNESYTLLQKFFLEEVFTDKKLAETALVLTNRPADVFMGAEDLSISLTYHMLKAKIFHNTATNIQPAIYSLIHQATDNINQSLLPSLLRLYCDSSFDSSGPFSKLPIETSHVVHALQNTLSTIAEQGLLCFCVFYHRQQWQTMTSENATTYSDEFLDSLHLRPVLDYAEEHTNDSPLYAQLVALIFTQCPEYFDPNIYLDTQKYATPFDLVDWSVHAQIQSSCGNITPETFDKLILNPDGYLLRRIIEKAEGQEENVIKILKALYRKPARAVFCLLDTLLLLLLHLLQKNLGLRMLQYHPQQTFFKTMAKLNELPLFRNRSGIIQPRDDSGHLQSVLNLGKTFVKSPSLLPIFLHLVSVSALLFTKKINRSKMLSEAQKSSVLLAKNAAIFQSLLELCDPDPGMQVSVRELCQYIHQIFVNHVASLRLVHFQGYDTRLISLAVEHIPSLHVAIDLIPELLIEPVSRDRFVFTVTLASHLFSKYPLEKSMLIAKDVVLPAIYKWALPIYTIAADSSSPASAASVVAINLAATAQCRSIGGLTDIMPSLVTLGFAFPMLLDTIAKLLSDLETLLRKIKKSSDSQLLEDAVMKTLVRIASEVIHCSGGLNKSLM